MIWIVASIPFWIFALVIAIIGIACIAIAFDDKYSKSQGIYDQRGGYFIFGILCLPMAGTAAALAAKIAS